MNLHLLIAFCLFLTIPPYFVWHTPIISIANIFLGLLFLIDSIKTKSNSNILLFICYLMLYVYIISSGDRNIMGIISILFLVPISLTKQTSFISIYQYFKKIYSLSLIISLVVFISVFIIGINLPYSVIQYLVEGKRNVCISYPFLISEITGGPNFRFYGMFDEPGVVGTFSALILLTENFNLKDKFNIPVLLGGIFSLSLFFWIICIIYIFVVVKNKYKLLIISSACLLIYLLYDNEILYQFVFRRFEIRDGKFVGDTRSDNFFNDFYDNYKQTPSFYTGLGTGMGAYYNEGGCSYKQLIVDYGIIFFIFYSLTHIIKACMLLNRALLHKFIYILLFSTLIYQRPFITNYSYVFMLISSMYIIPCYYNKQSK